MNYQEILEDIYENIKPEIKRGKVANYIPALARVKKEQFAMSITLLDGSTYSV